MGPRSARAIGAAEALQPDNERSAAEHPDLHIGWLLFGGRGRFQTAGQSVPGVGGAIPRRPGNCDCAGLRIPYFVHRRVGCDDPGVGRCADAGVAGGAVYGAGGARLADGRGLAGNAFSAMPAADSLRYRREPQRAGEHHDQTDVPGRDRAGNFAGDPDGALGNSAGAKESGGAAEVQLEGSGRGALGCEMGIADSGGSDCIAIQRADDGGSGGRDRDLCAAGRDDDSSRFAAV